MSETKTIRTDYLARVEGEGGMLVRMRDGEVAEVKLRIYEPPRFFEAFLRGRLFTEAPDITARICGICPVAYQMAACLAMESLCGVEVDGQLRALRRLLYCGEWIESHTLHVYMLHAPDFLGVASAVELAQTSPELVERALRMKKIGNEVMRVVGGREVHPINVRVGGWYKAPSKAQLDALVPDLEWALEQSQETVRLVATLDFPKLEMDSGARRPRRRRRVSDRSRRAAHLLARPRHPDRRVLRPRRRGARRALERPPRAPARARLLPRRPLCALRAAPRAALPQARAAADEVGLEPLVRNPFRSIIVALGRARARVRGGAPPDRGVRGAGGARDRGHAARRLGPRGERGPARRALPPLPARRRRH